MRCVITDFLDFSLFLKASASYSFFSFLKICWSNLFSISSRRRTVFGYIHLPLSIALLISLISAVFSCISCYFSSSSAAFLSLVAKMVFTVKKTSQKMPLMSVAIM